MGFGAPTATPPKRVGLSLGLDRAGWQLWGATIFGKVSNTRPPNWHRLSSTLTWPFILRGSERLRVDRGTNSGTYTRNGLTRRVQLGTARTVKRSSGTELR